MPTQIDHETERADTMRGQHKSGPGSATNAVIPGPDHYQGVAVDSLPYPFSLAEAFRRNQLALSILNHRGADADSVREAIRALEGTSILELRPAGDA